ncbi:MAG: thiol-disulfide oxidoreductase DCC family protein [Candidatus Eisenbacteria bacterium]
MIVYDASCPICRATVRALRGLDADRLFEYADASDRDRLRRDVPQVDPGQAMEKIHVVLPGGGVRAGFSALLAIVSALPGCRPLAVALGLPGIRWIGEKAYAVFARHRPRRGGGREGGRGDTHAVREGEPRPGGREG